MEADTPLKTTGFAFDFVESPIIFLADAGFGGSENLLYFCFVALDVLIFVSWTKKLSST